MKTDYKNVVSFKKFQEQIKVNHEKITEQNKK